MPSTLHPGSKKSRVCVALIVLFLSLSSLGTSEASGTSNITIIGTTGGYIYGIDSHSLEKKWAVNTGGPLLSAEQVRILLRHSLILLYFYNFPIHFAVIVSGRRNVPIFFVPVT
jgi:hypothetical protein